MTDKRIIYPNGDNVAVIIPATKTTLTVEQIAKKDTPTGTPYLIVDATDVPSDRTDRHLWTADFSNPDGYGSDTWE